MRAAGSSCVFTVGVFLIYTIQVHAQPLCAMTPAIALVKPLLNDPHFSFYSRDNSTTGERYYAARHASYQTLKAWGLAVEPPVFREDVR